MKKLILLIICFSGILLAGCNNPNNVPNNVNNNKVSSTIIDNTNEKTISKIQTNNNETKENNKVTKKEVPKLIIKNHNLVLEKGGKIIQITKDGKPYDCSKYPYIPNNFYYDQNKKKFMLGGIKYKILAQNGDYAVIQKDGDSCQGYGIRMLYLVNLKNYDGKKYLIYYFTIPMPTMVRVELNKDNVKLIFKPDSMFYTEDDLVYFRKKGFKTKVINSSKGSKEFIVFKNFKISDIIKKGITDKEYKFKIPNEYKPENLLKKGYKVNNLGKIQEYYKKDCYDNGQPQNPGQICEYDTVYINKENNKMLDVKVITRGAGGTSGFMGMIKIFDGNKKYEIWEDDNVGNSNYSFLELGLSDNGVVQPVFKVKDAVKLLVMPDLDNVKVYSKVGPDGKKLNEIIWNRFDSFLKNYDNY